MRRPQLHAAGRQRGMGMVELLVAMVIGLFMLAGMFTIFYSSRQTWSAQQGLAGLQDNERLAMTLIANVIQPAGYFPDPLTRNVLAALPVASPFTVAGQAIVGSTDAGGDRLAVRFVSAPGDGLLNCLGRSNTGSTNATWVNQFQVDAGKQQLQCTLNGQTHGLVSGVTAMHLLYGVDTDGDGSADRYLAAANVADWSAVRSVRITLDFANPLAGQAGQPQTLAFARTVALMSLT